MRNCSSVPDPVGGVTRRGRVVRVEEGHRLDFTWWPALRPAERTAVSITLAPLDDGTRVRVVERPLTPVMARSATEPTSQPMAGAAQGSRTIIGSWSWRLALLSLTCTLSRV